MGNAGNQAEPGGMVVKQPQGLPFPGAQMIVEVVAEVTQALRDGEAVRSRLGGGDRRQVGPALVAGGLEPGGQPRLTSARALSPMIKMASALVSPLVAPIDKGSTRGRTP